MSDKPIASLPDVHVALSNLHFAVTQEFPTAEVKVGWDQYNYLHVDVTVASSQKQLVIDRLKHGVLNGSYDYRFDLSYSMSDSSPRQTVRGHVRIYR